MLGCVLVDSEAALLPETTNPSQLILMLPGFDVNVAHQIF
jgi:hypothetical protein